MKRLAAILLVLMTLATTLLIARGMLEGAQGSLVEGATPGLRAVDMDRYLRRVQEGRLSDREALWWVPLQQ
jgi:hypothetical protein